MVEDETEANDEAVLGEPEKVADLPAGAGAVPLHLYVSNQSFDISPVGIDVWIDQAHAIRGGFDVEGQHNWILFDFQLDAGSHQLRAESLNGTVVIDTTIAVPAERWGVLDFWFYPGEPTHPMFTWSLHDSQVGFN